jgi:hypothetical protein
MRTYIILGFVSMILATGCRSKEVKAVTEEEVIDLVKLYQQGAGADDIAGPQLKSGGEQTKAILIKLLDNSTTPQELLGTVAQILHVYFPSDETYDALDRFAERIKDPEEREKTRQMMKVMRSMPRER